MRNKSALWKGLREKSCGKRVRCHLIFATFGLVVLALSFLDPGWKPCKPWFLNRVWAKELNTAYENQKKTQEDQADTAESANDIKPNSVTRGSFHHCKDVDYFRLQLTSFGELTLFTTGTAHIIGRLEDEYGVLALDESGVSVRNNFYMTKMLHPGVYYIALTGNSDEYVAYSLFCRYIVQSPTANQSLEIFQHLNRALSMISHWEFNGEEAMSKFEEAREIEAILANIDRFYAEMSKHNEMFDADSIIMEFDRDWDRLLNGTTSLRDFVTTWADMSHMEPEAVNSTSQNFTETRASSLLQASGVPEQNERRVTGNIDVHYAGKVAMGMSRGDVVPDAGFVREITGIPEGINEDADAESLTAAAEVIQNCGGEADDPNWWNDFNGSLRDHHGIPRGVMSGASPTELLDNLGKVQWVGGEPGNTEIWDDLEGGMSGSDFVNKWLEPGDSESGSGSQDVGGGRGSNSNSSSGSSTGDKPLGDIGNDGSGAGNNSGSSAGNSNSGSGSGSSSEGENQGADANKGNSKGAEGQNETSGTGAPEGNSENSGGEAKGGQGEGEGSTSCGSLTIKIGDNSYTSSFDYTKNGGGSESGNGSNENNTDGTADKDQDDSNTDEGEENAEDSDSDTDSDSEKGSGDNTADDGTDSGADSADDDEAESGMPNPEGNSAQGHLPDVDSDQCLGQWLRRQQTVINPGEPGTTSSRDPRNLRPDQMPNPSYHANPYIIPDDNTANSVSGGAGSSLAPVTHLGSDGLEEQLEPSSDRVESLQADAKLQAFGGGFDPRVDPKGLHKTFRP